jgi:transposase
MGSNKNEQPARRRKRTFTAEFKAEALALVSARRAKGVSLTQIARELEVTPNQLRAWARDGRDDRGEEAGGSAVPGETLEQENRRLRRENATLRQEQAFAKKVAVYFAKESR